MGEFGDRSAEKNTGNLFGKKQKGRKFKKAKAGAISSMVDPITHAQHISVVDPALGLSINPGPNEDMSKKKRYTVQTEIAVHHSICISMPVNLRRRSEHFRSVGRDLPVDWI